ncbi:MAG: hypothetical protein DI525_05565 [Corynebacterium kroppenstedtii]|uniref:Uncharacterized protein n=1 Tax=Corynebacterium kroppenstedtii TaxID=161879 RepID=A0A2W5SPU8_9CORY|nr:MAG: hypothetical protein DI525_05565 [Corynebacterium kroppenstedtii]
MACAGLAGIRTPEEPGRSRIGAFVAVLLAIPAVIVLVLIAKDGSKPASIGELFGVAGYAFIVSVSGGYLLEKRKRT